jgi:uncharacterized membrane protein YfcA
MTLAIGLSLLIGLLLGILGGGGSILTVPMLVYVLNIDPKSAIVTSLVVVGISSLIAIIPHARSKSVCWKSGFFFGLAGMGGAYGGGWLAAYCSGEMLMVLFGLVTLITGLAMLRGRQSVILNSPPGVGGAVCPAKVPYPRVLFDGFFVGFLTGLVGVGGGFMIVPALAMLVRLPMHAAVGTSLLVIAMNAIAGLGGYASHVSIDLNLTAIVTGGAVIGAIIGGLLSKRISATVLRRLFGGFVLLVAGYVLSQSVTFKLLFDLKGLMERHLEFVLGMATLSFTMAIYHIGKWIHKTEPDLESVCDIDTLGVDQSCDTLRKSNS